MFIAALAVAVVGGPFLMFPDLLPAGWRLGAVTVATLVALGLALAMLAPWKRLRFGLWLFVLAVVGSWAAMPSHDLVGMRHFGGIGAGLLATAVVATWCTTRDRLMTAGLLFALAATGILTLGLLGAASNFNTTKFVTWFNLLPPSLLERLLRFRLGLPGVEAAGRVNPNALGGTALLLLPACAGLAAAALAIGGRRVALLVGGLATVVALAVLGITLSRTAWLGGFLTLVLLGLRWRRGQRWIALAIVVATIGAAYGIYQWRAAGVTMFDRDLRLSAGTRATIWGDGIAQLREAPWLGVGINQFHEIRPASGTDGETHVAHAHNTLLQVALDIGLPGLCGYVLLIGVLLLEADRAARRSGAEGRVAAGAGLSLVGIHFFGLGDAIALGAKVGLFQWLCAGLILAAAHLQSSGRLPGPQPDRRGE